MKLRKAFFPLIVLVLWSSVAFGQDSKENSEFKLAVGLYNDAMYDLATEQLKNFVAAYPSTSQGIEARFYLGLSQMKVKRYDDARLTFQNFALAYVDHPKAPEAWMNVGEAFLAIGNEREAASAFERVRVFHSKSDLAAEGLLKSAMLYRKLVDRDAARKALRTIIQEYPTSKSVLPARLAIGEMYAEEGQMDLAEKEARRVAESDAPASVRASALFAIGRMQADACLFDNAMETFSQIAAEHKGTAIASRASLERGAIELLRGNYPAALELLKAVAETDKLDDSLQARGLFLIGNIYERQKSFSNARKSYERLLAAYPESRIAVDALFGAARAADREERFAEAASHAKKYLALASADGRRRGIVLAAQIALHLRQYAEAVRLYRMYLDKYPADRYASAIRLQLGIILHDSQRDYRGAMLAYEQLLQNDPESPAAVEATERLALCQEALHDYDGALRSYLDLTERYPASPRASVASERINKLQNSTLTYRDSILTKLTRLMSEMLSDKPKPELAFRLGQIYFNDLNDYSAAEEQFRTAIKLGIEGNDRVDAEFLRIRSLHRGLTDSSSMGEIVHEYNAFLQRYPTSRWSEEASYYSFNYTFPGSSPEEQIALTEDYIAQHPASPYRETMLLNAARKASTLGVHNDAIQLFNQFIGTFPASRSVPEAWYLLGRSYQLASLPDSASISWMQGAAVVEYSPYTLDCLRSLASLRENLKDYPGALEIWKRIISEFPYSAEGADQRRVANDYLLSGDAHEATTLLREVLNSEQSSPWFSEELYDFEPLYLLAEANNAVGNRQSSIESYTGYIRSNYRGSYTSGAFQMLGKLARLQGNAATASSYFKQAAGFGAKGGATSEIAELLFQTNQYADAARQYRQLAQSSDSITSKSYFLARAVVALFRTDQLAEAQQLVLESGKLFSKQEDLLAEFEYEKGFYYFRKNDFGNAKKSFEKLTDDFRKTHFGPWGEYYLGKIAEVNNKPEDAAKKYENVIDTYTDSDVIPRALLSLGNMHFNVERYENAIRYYRRITAEPDRAGDILPYAMNNLIEAYESTKLYDEALKMTRDFIERYPGDESVIDKKIKIGTLYTKLGYYDQAILQLQSLLGEAGSLFEGELRYNTGEAYYYKGDYQQAILEFLKVPYLVSKQGKVDWTATSFYMAGQSYEKMSKFDEAIGMYQQIVERGGIDATFKAAARKEIDRVRGITKRGSK